MQDQTSQLCENCGKSLPLNKGSITQWIGLGDICKCNQKNTMENPRGHRKRAPRKCKRCSKPIQKNASMTQWLLKRDSCQCSDESEDDEANVGTDYTKLALDKRRKYRKTEDKESKATALALIVSVVLFITGCAAVVWFTLYSNPPKPYEPRVAGNAKTITYFAADTKEYTDPLLPDFKNWSDKLKTADIVIVKHATLTDEDLSNIGKLKNLQELKIVDCDGFTGDGIESLAKHGSFKEITLQYSNFEHGAFAALENLKVDSLCLDYTNIRNNDWNTLAQNKSLRSVSMIGVEIEPNNEAKMKKGGMIKSHTYFYRNRSSLPAENAPRNVTKGTIFDTTR